MEMTFGSRIKELRLERRMNQRNVAEQARIDVTYLSKIENGKIEPPSEDTVRRLAVILGQEPTELILLAKKVPSDVREIVTASPEIPAFLRTARNLTTDQWRALRREIESNQAGLFDHLSQTQSKGDKVAP